MNDAVQNPKNTAASIKQRAIRIHAALVEAREDEARLKQILEMRRLRRRVNAATKK